MIILTGIPGCGKTSLLKMAQQVVPELQVVNYGDCMLEVASLQKTDRDTLRKMDVEQQKAISIKTAQRIARESNNLTLVDTHALIRTPWGYCPGLPKEVLEILKPQVCAVVECSPAIIARRRSQDHAIRGRDVESEEELNVHQELARAYLCSCCMLTGAFLCRINNDSDALEKNISPLIQALQMVRG